MSFQIWKADVDFFRRQRIMEFDSVLGRINRKCPGIGCLVGKNTNGECYTFPDVDWCRAHNAIVYGLKKKKK